MNMATSTKMQLLRIFTIVLTIGMSNAYAGELGLDIFGFSYHYDGSTYMDNGREKDYNEVNPGLGVHYTISESDKHIWLAKGGFYKDSKENQSLYLGPGYQYKVTENFHVGGGILLFNSDTYSSPIIPLPLVTYRYKMIRLNATWIPAGDSSESAAVALFITINIW